MPIFQNTVVTKHLQSQNKELLTQRWELYKSYFHNLERQENIRNSKEEQFQEGFLRELFVNILGYTLNPEPNFNLTTEYKNVKDSKKADGAILISNKVKAVIELKGTDTTDLSKVESQAFGYKNNQPDCIYVITSNFEKIRFYIDNAIEHIEFNLFTLTKEEFDLMYLALGYENISKGLAKKLKEESLSKEEEITKELYKDYSLFKRQLHQNLVALNPNYDALLLFKKSQKLLDRFLFLFFAEDRLLLPPNSVRLVLSDWKDLIERDVDVSLYNRFKKYFGYLNTGFKGKRYDVFAYNGGLFKTDDVLDNVRIDDELLYNHTKQLSEYDFESEVDVNILGHIFENSLNEIEEVQAELEGQVIDRSKTKRKKDGVFYTPKYITKYIVENTVGKLCNEKKSELDITDVAYQPATKRSRKRLDNLQTYRDWLLQLTICDPACGSGAFLNEALNYLIAEHRYIDELSAKYNKDTLLLSDVENSILENNLFGVDLNEESVEIAKLSLWLRTAQPNRKLNDLSNNIKCGNSLIDDPEIAGNKAFNWQQEFPHIFKNGGFDVIIGNPPYVPTEYINEIDKIYLEKKYQSAFGRINLYPIFYEKGIIILKKNGYLGYITPYTILKNQYYKEARSFILKHSAIIELIDFKGNLVFLDAAVDSIVLLLRKKEIKNYNLKYINNIKSFEEKLFDEHYYNVNEITSNDDLSMQMSLNEKLIKRLSKKSTPLKSIIDFNQGIITGGNSKFLTDVKNEHTVNIITGSDFNRYSLKTTQNYLIYDTKKLHRPRKKSIFEVKEKILLRQTSSYPIATIDKNKSYTLDTVHNGLLINKNYDLRFIIALLNSKLIKFIYESFINESGKVFAQVKIIYIDPLPIPIIKLENQKKIIDECELMLQLNKELQNISHKFQRTLLRKFETLKVISKKLELWYELTYNEFVIELKKKKIALSISEEAEWEDYFLAEQQKAQALQSQINQTDKIIDQLVYHLYGLTEEEINIVERA